MENNFQKFLFYQKEDWVNVNKNKNIIGLAQIY
jgi:hypothetical protein